MDNWPEISDDLFISHYAKLAPRCTNAHIFTHNHFSVLHINARSLQNKMSQFELLYFYPKLILSFNVSPYLRLGLTGTVFYERLLLNAIIYFLLLEFAKTVVD